MATNPATLLGLWRPAPLARAHTMMQLAHLVLELVLRMTASTDMAECTDVVTPRCSKIAHAHDVLAQSARFGPIGFGLARTQPQTGVLVQLAQVVRTLSEVTAQVAAPEGLIQLAQVVRSLSEAPVVLALVVAATNAAETAQVTPRSNGDMLFGGSWAQLLTMQRPPATMLGEHRNCQYRPWWLAQSKQTWCLCGGC